ncbi:MAG: T9SS type A sorting domain-containing protein [Bacteroidota bacterium]
MKRLHSSLKVLLFTILYIPFLQAQLAYIPNLGDGTVSVIDVNTDQVMTTITTEGAPFAVAISPNNDKVYITDITTNSLIEIDVATNTVARTVAVGATPFGVAVNPQTGTIYVANFSSGNISVIDPITFATIATLSSGFRPYGIAHHPMKDTVINTNFSGNNLSIIGKNGVLRGATPLGLSPVGVTYSADGTKVYATNFGWDSISELDGNTLATNRLFPAGDAPFGVALNSDGSKLYVSNENSDDVSVINTTTGFMEASIPVGGIPSGISVSPDDTKVYVTSREENSVYVINTTTNTVTTTISVGNDPRGLGKFIVDYTIPDGIPDITTLRTQLCPLPYTASFDPIENALAYLIEIKIPALDNRIITRVVQASTISIDFTIPQSVQGTTVEIRLAAIFLDSNGNEVTGAFSATGEVNIPFCLTEIENSALEARAGMDHNLSIAPNPVNNRLNINLASSAAQNINLSIYNTSGKLLRKVNFDIHSGRNNLTLEIADLAEGAYFLQLQSVEGVQQWKFVKL